MTTIGPDPSNSVVGFLLFACWRVFWSKSGVATRSEGEIVRFSMGFVAMFGSLMVCVVRSLVIV